MEDCARVLLGGVYTNPGFTLDDLPSKPSHTDYTPHLLELEPKFHDLSHPDLPYETIPVLSQTNHMPIGTMQRWQKQLLIDSSWRPGERYGHSSRLLTDEEEADLAATIRHDYISTHKYCPPKLIMQMARWLHQDHRATGSADSTDLSDESDSEELGTTLRRRNEFTHKWRERFLNSHGFSLRRPHILRRLKPNYGILAHFLTDGQIAFQQYPPDRILNADETSWKILNNRMVTVADCGSESIACEFDGNIKGCVTVITSIDASGGKLTFWVICRGTTIRRES
jgi:hypothetical protein